MKINLSLNSNGTLGDYRFTNWKKVFKWAGTIATVGFGIAAIVASGPLGWIGFGITAIFSLFEWLSDSREDKLKESLNSATKCIVCC